MIEAQGTTDPSHKNIQPSRNEGVTYPKSMGFHILDGEDDHGSITYFVFRYEYETKDGKGKWRVQSLKATITADRTQALNTTTHSTTRKKRKVRVIH